MCAFVFSNIMLLMYVLAIVFGLARADYDCLCNYNVEQPVYLTASNLSRTFGYLYEFDCKPIVNNNVTDTSGNHWMTVAFEHKEGYVPVNTQIQPQVCPGLPDPGDLPTTSTSRPKTMASTTQPTTVKSPTVQTTTSTHLTTTVPFTTRPTTTTAAPTTETTTTTMRSSTIRTTTRTHPTTTVPSSTVRTPAGTTQTTTKTSTVKITLTHPTTPPPTTRKTTPKATTQTTSSSLSTTQKMFVKSTSNQQAPSTKHALHLHGNAHLCSYHHRQMASHGSILNGYGHSCYEFVNRNVSWTTADNYCQRRFGHLVQINDTEEEAFIQQFMMSHSPNHAVWIGLHDRYNEEIFAWTTGDRPQYTNWVPGRMNNFQNHDTEDCVLFLPYKQGQWDDVSCGHSGFLFHHHDHGEIHPYICEYIASGSAFPVGNPGMPSGSGGYHGMPSGSDGYHGMPSGSGGYHGMPSGSGGYHGIPSGSGGYHGMPSGSGGNNGMPSGSGGNNGMPSGSGGYHGIPSGSGGYHGMPSGSGGNNGMPSGSGGYHGMPSGSGGNPGMPSGSGGYPGMPSGSGGNNGMPSGSVVPGGNLGGPFHGQMGSGQGVGPGMFTG